MATRGRRRPLTSISRPRAEATVPEPETLRGRIHRLFGEFANWVSTLVGSPWAFLLAVLSIVVWSLTGPVFRYSDTWQLVINTGTTIVTFLMVFVIQHTQNKDARAIQLKLNELIAAVEGASGRLINVEKMSDEELDRLHEQFQRLAEEIRERGEVVASHSVEEELEDGEGGRRTPATSAQRSVSRGGVETSPRFPPGS